MKIEMGKLRGTRVLTGAAARAAREAEDAFRGSLHRPWLRGGHRARDLVAV